MHDPIPDPVSGKSVLDWAVPVTRRLNSLSDKVGATARNERDRRGTSADLGCFRMEKTTNDQDEIVTVFGNQYYRVGDFLKLATISTTVEELLIDAGEADEETGEMELFIALRLSAKPGAPATDANGDPLPRVEGFGSLSALSQAQGDLDYHVLPLYLLSVIEDGETGDRSFAVRCDFRRGVAQAWEEAT